jgi:hypothetical protein
MKLSKLIFCIRIVVIVLAGIMVTVLVGGQPKDVDADTLNKTAQSSATSSKVVEETLTGLKYSGGLGDDGVVHVLVSFDGKTANGLKAFDKANRELVKEVQGTIAVSVVFQRPISIDEFKEIVQASGIKVKSYDIRAVENDGTRITVNSVPSSVSGELVPAGMLNQAMNAWKSKPKGATFKGIIDVDAVATQDQIKKLLNDKRIFTTEIARSVTAQRIVSKVGLNSLIPTQGYLSDGPLYWQLEETGLAPK